MRVEVSNDERSITIADMYPDDFNAFIRLLEQSGSPQFEAVAATIKEYAREDIY